MEGLRPSFYITLITRAREHAPSTQNLERYNFLLPFFFFAFFFFCHGKVPHAPTRLLSRWILAAYWGEKALMGVDPTISNRERNKDAIQKAISIFEH